MYKGFFNVLSIIIIEYREQISLHRFLLFQEVNPTFVFLLDNMDQHKSSTVHSSTRLTFILGLVSP
jgi:hypothetical protein